MKHRFFISRIGMRGSVGFLIIGIALLTFGGILQYYVSKMPDNTGQATATITGFENVRKMKDSSITTTTVTLVSYEADGVTYDAVTLGQYEASWHEGDSVEICYSKDNPEVIWTKTMQYRGIITILVSVPFLTIGLYKIVQFWRNKDDPETEDEDMEEEEEEKYRISSFIIPLTAGIPIALIGLFVSYIEKHPYLGQTVVVLGCSAIIAGLISFIQFIRTKVRH